MDKIYLRDLEKFVAKLLEPMLDLPFRAVIKSISGYNVLSYKSNKKMEELLKKSLNNVGKEINLKGIISSRPNEVGNKIEPFVKESLVKFGIKAETPCNIKGKKVSAGYSDVFISFEGSPYYLECKTYNQRNINTTQRSFYFSPSRNCKITKDAPHLLVSYEIFKNGRRYFTKHWKLYSLENLKVDLKHEFNQHNRELYGSESNLNLISEASLE